MKTSGFILIVVLLISISANAQTKLNLKSDSLIINNDSILSKFQNQLKFKSPFGLENRRFVLPGNKKFHLNPNLAVIPKQRPSVYADPNFRMPILKPSNYSKMPVMKPDTSIHYFLRIMRINKIVR